MEEEEEEEEEEEQKEGCPEMMLHKVVEDVVRAVDEIMVLRERVMAGSWLIGSEN